MSNTTGSFFQKEKEAEKAKSSRDQNIMANGDESVPVFQPKWIATDQIDGVLEYLKAVE